MQALAALFFKTLVFKRFQHVETGLPDCVIRVASVRPRHGSTVQGSQHRQRGTLRPLQRRQRLAAF